VFGQQDKDISVCKFFCFKLTFIINVSRCLVVCSNLLSLVARSVELSEAFAVWLVFLQSGTAEEYQQSYSQPFACKAVEDTSSQCMHCLLKF